MAGRRAGARSSKQRENLKRAAARLCWLRDGLLSLPALRLPVIIIICPESGRLLLWLPAPQAMRKALPGDNGGRSDFRTGR